MSEEVQKLEEMAIAPVPFTRISQTAGRLAMRFVLPGVIARLYLYLFGEFDRFELEEVIEKVTETKSVVDEIMAKRKTPMRAVYDFLIEVKLLEDQELSPAAMVHIDMPDSLQLRIEDPVEESDKEPA